MDYRQRLRLLIINMTAISLVVGGISIYFLNRLSLQQQKNRLVDIAQSQAQLLEAIDHTTHDANLALNIVKNAAQNFRALSGTGEITIGSRRDHQIVFLFHHRYDTQPIPQAVSWGDRVAQPMQRALRGESGTIIATDYRGVKVLAAYEPIGYLNWGVVAKIDASEVEISWIEAGLYLLLITALLDIIGVILFRRLSQPIVHQLEQQDTLIEKRTMELMQSNEQVRHEIGKRQRLEISLRREIDLLGRIMETSPVGIIMVNSEGKIALASDRAEQILGLSKEEITQRTYNAPQWHITDCEGQTLLDEALPFQQVLRTKQPIYDLRHGIELPNGHQAFLSINGVPLFDEAKALEGVVFTIEDITERIQVEAALLHSEAQFRAIFEQAAVGISIMTLMGQLIRVNQRYCQFLGYKEADLQGKNFYTIVHPDDAEKYRDSIERVWESGIDTFCLEQRYLRSNGLSMWVNLSASVVRNFEGEPTYLIGVVEDIQEQKQAIAALQDSEERYRRIIETTTEGVWIIDARNHTVFVNERMAQMLGYTVSEMVKQSIFDFFDARSRIGIGEILESRSQRITESYDFKFLRKDGSYIWTMISINPIYDADNQYAGALGMLTDITERKQTEEALQLANEQLTDWIQELEQRNREILLLNQISDFLQACHTVEEAYRVIGDLLQPLFPNCAGGLFVLNSSTNIVESVTTWGESLKSKTLFTFDECWALRRGQIHWVGQGQTNLFCSHVEHLPQLAASLCVPMMAQGKAVGLLYLTGLDTGQLSETKQRLAQTVAEHLSLALVNLKLRETLQKQSVRDPLTGLYNQRYMEESLKREINIAKRKHYPVGVIMLDVDHFKNFNDKFGHDAGNLVLKEVSNFLIARIRSGDIACRYGGEEFLLILPEAPLENLLLRAEQIREGIKQLQLNYDGRSLHQITVSIGVACFPEHGQTKDALIKAADISLYRAKGDGRDRVRSYSRQASQREDNS